MTEQTPQAGHNHPPSPLEEVLATYDDVFDAVKALATGEPIENDGEWGKAEKFLGLLKDAKKEVGAAKESEYRPIKTVYDKAKNTINKLYNPVTADIDKQIKCLLDLINPYKQKLLEAQQAATRIANEAAAKAKAEAIQAATEQRSGSIEDARNTTELADEAIEAEKFAKKVAKPTVKGLRTKRKGVIVDGKALINWIATNDKPALKAFMEGYTKDHVRNNRGALPGVRVDTTKESF